MGSLQSVNPASGVAFGHAFKTSTRAELEAMARAAHATVECMADAPGAQLAGFLEEYARLLDADRSALAQLAHEETALPLTPRLSEVEFNRMLSQLRSGARALIDESWRTIAIDAPNQLRSTLVPLGGAVVCIGPSNFPLAFHGVSGGDFCAAIVARNPVIAKAHPGHLGTSARLYAAACAAREKAGLPAAAVQMFFDCASDDGLALLEHRGVAALAFTGSRASGLRLKAVCDALGKPSSLEMSSVNPVFVARGAAAARAETIGESWATALLLGGGQFCTKPGVLLVVGADAAQRLTSRVAELLRAAAPPILLTESVRKNFLERVKALRSVCGEPICGGGSSELAGFRVEPTLFRVAAGRARAERVVVMQEAFGPVGVVLEVEDDAALVEFAHELEGQLACTVVADESDAATRAALYATLRFRAGRLLDEAMPTGVVVSNAMVHGGPMPATNDPRFTAVGLPESAKRFSKALCLDRVR